MTSISKTALIPYSAAKMYDLVADVDSYEQFLPWCGASKILDKTDDEVTGRVEIQHLGLNKTFTTLNRMQKNKLIEMRLVDGPFKQLHGFWRFDALDENGCKISLDLEFEFSSKMMSMAFGPIFSQIANSMVDAFCKRAVVVYG
ncbi:type II toxin-antitoxin system RatA family toxin [sulfur-oxidizing endosymbiont of Gigantopelta aegis]|uniref:type II toxin-antitoxin system RatA family toxin n=1 Tax=sulfur-oxidizing endosymbiont of Gigantopelta aegis TaxID=2794934 RepID=UPI0018DC7C6E|nr:type II toxin-antitoxin system RatA family toxin [sulfur-oxidizing endosymbiont of Gigantopelta aegis]